MRARTNLARCCLAAFAVGALTLRAEESSFSTAFKIRGELSSNASSQGMTNNVLGQGLELGAGFGLELGYKLGVGKITGELGYSVQTGDEFLSNTSGLPVSSSTVKVNPVTSIESRKNKVEGMMFRLGYEAPWTESVAWRAGIQIGGNTFTHQVIGNTYGTVNGPTAFSDSYYFVGSKSTYTPSPYGGVTINFDEQSALEVGVIFLQYTALNYQHVANSNNSMDMVLEKKRIVPNLEVAYVFRF